MGRAHAHTREVAEVTARTRFYNKAPDLAAHLGSFDVGALGERRVRHQIRLRARSLMSRATQSGHLPPGDMPPVDMPMKVPD